jgi:hypothetical protein
MSSVQDWFGQALLAFLMEQQRLLPDNEFSENRPPTLRFVARSSSSLSYVGDSK